MKPLINLKYFCLIFDKKYFRKDSLKLEFRVSISIPFFGARIMFTHDWNIQILKLYHLINHMNNLHQYTRLTLKKSNNIGLRKNMVWKIIDNNRKDKPMGFLNYLESQKTFLDHDWSFIYYESKFHSTHHNFISKIILNDIKELIRTIVKSRKCYQIFGWDGTRNAIAFKYPDHAEQFYKKYKEELEEHHNTLIKTGYKEGSFELWIDKLKELWPDLVIMNNNSYYTHALYRYNYQNQNKPIKYFYDFKTDKVIFKCDDDVLLLRLKDCT